MSEPQSLVTSVQSSDALTSVASGSYPLGSMRSVGLKLLKNKLSEYVRRAALGETVLVTDRDRVVAELVPPSAGRSALLADAILADAVRNGWLRAPLMVSEGPPPRIPVDPRLDLNCSRSSRATATSDDLPRHLRRPGPSVGRRSPSPRLALGNGHFDLQPVARVRGVDTASTRACLSKVTRGEPGLRQLVGRVALLELAPPVLSRVLEPFPVVVRTLDALHLASLEFLREIAARRSNWRATTSACLSRPERSAFRC